MSKTQVLILWIIAALLGIAVATVKINSNKGPDAVTALKRGDQLAGDFPARQVALVKVSSAEDTATLRQTESGWVVEERDHYPANSQMLGDFLTTLMDVEVAQSLQAGATYNQRFGMDASSKKADDHGLHVIFNDADGKELATLTLGKRSDSGDAADPMAMMMGGGSSGRYVRIDSDPESVYVVDETFPRITANPKDWLDETFLEVKKIQGIQLQAPGDEDFQAWTLTRADETADFALEGLTAEEEMNSSATDPLKNLFSFARFEDVLNNENAAPLRDQEQDRQVVITTFDGFTYTIDLAPKLAAASDEGDDSAPAAGSDHYLLTVKVTGEFPEKRPAVADEKPEDATKRDEEFSAAQKALKESLAKQKKLEGRTFEVTKWTVNSLLKTRAELVQEKTEAATDAVPSPVPGLPGGLPGGFPAPNPNPPLLQPNPGE